MAIDAIEGYSLAFKNASAREVAIDKVLLEGNQYEIDSIFHHALRAIGDDGSEPYVANVPREHCLLGGSGFCGHESFFTDELLVVLRVHPHQIQTEVLSIYGYEVFT